MHVLVLFKNPLDNTVIHTITQHISRGKKYGELVDMLHHVLDHHRYITGNERFKNFPQIEISYQYFCYGTHTSPDYISFGKIKF